MTSRSTRREPSEADMVNAVVMWSGAYTRAVAFYRALGLPLADEQHDDGPAHAAAELGGVHVAIYDAPGAATLPGHREPGGTLVGFEVDDLDATLARLAAPIIRAPE